MNTPSLLKIDIVYCSAASVLPVRSVFMCVRHQSAWLLTAATDQMKNLLPYFRMSWLLVFCFLFVCF